jgi:hypothetical protein
MSLESLSLEEEHFPSKGTCCRASAAFECREEISPPNHFCCQQPPIPIQEQAAKQKDRVVYRSEGVVGKGTNWVVVDGSLSSLVMVHGLGTCSTRGLLKRHYYKGWTQPARQEIRRNLYSMNKWNVSCAGALPSLYTISTLFLLIQSHMQHMSDFWIFTIPQSMQMQFVLK